MAKKKLADYQAKRDFKKTSEPSGKARFALPNTPALSSRSTTLRASTMTYALNIMASSSPGR